MATTAASIEAIIILSLSIFNNEPSISGIPADIITRGIQIVIKSVILSKSNYTSKLLLFRLWYNVFVRKNKLQNTKEK
jgi:hypothetical protein